MTRPSWRRPGPDANPAGPDQAAEIRAAIDLAHHLHGRVSLGYVGVDLDLDGLVPAGLAEELVERIDAVARSGGSRSMYVTGLLHSAAAGARRLRDRADGAPALRNAGPRASGLAAASLQLELLRAVGDTQAVIRALDSAAVSAGRLRDRYPGAGNGRVRVDDDRPTFSAAAPAYVDLRPRPTRTVEVTLPGLLVGIAVLLLPAEHRSRYSEEFRAEVRDLPAEEQVGYSWRQCLFALSLRGGLTRPAWFLRRGPDRADDPPTERGPWT